MFDFIFDPFHGAFQRLKYEYQKKLECGEIPLHLHALNPNLGREGVILPPVGFPLITQTQ